VNDIALVSAKDGEKLYNNKKEDMVSLSATIAFLRASLATQPQS
jgi:hypothetical protein